MSQPEGGSGSYGSRSETAASKKGDEGKSKSGLPPIHIAQLLTDAHCHPTDDPRLRVSLDSDQQQQQQQQQHSDEYQAEDDEDDELLPRGTSVSIDTVYDSLTSHPLRNICIMSSSVDDQHLVRQIATISLQHQHSATHRPTTIIPAFGHHPWHTHRISLQNPPLPKKQHYLDLFLRSREEDQQALPFGAHNFDKSSSSSSSPRPTDEPPATSPQPTEELLSLIDHLPEPVPLEDVLNTLRADLETFPHALLGEVGLDRSFRLPWPPKARAARRAAAKAAAAAAAAAAADGPPADSDKPPRPFATKLAWTLSSYTTPLSHQVAVLQAQMCVAIDLRRSVSFHSVKAQGATSDFFMHMTRLRPRGWGIGFSDIKVDLHSCTISAPGIIQIQKTHANVFVSFSTTINTRQKALHEQIQACDPQRLLVESDYNSALPYKPRTWPPRDAAAEAAGQVRKPTIDKDAPLLEFPLARRTYAIVQCMAEVLDVRNGIGPESGTLYGRKLKENKRQKAAKAGNGSLKPAKNEAGPSRHGSSSSDDDDDDEGDAEQEEGCLDTSQERAEGEKGDEERTRLEREEALAKLLAANWTRFLDNRTPGYPDRPLPDAGAGAAGKATASNSGGKGEPPSHQAAAQQAEDSDSDDEWDPVARQEVLRQRQQRH